MLVVPVAISLIAAGCGEVVSSTGQEPPTASFTVNRDANETLLTVTVDATESADPNRPAQDLQFRWDWEDDGEWDTSWSSNPVREHVFNAAGEYTIRLEVRNESGLTASTTRNVEVSGSAGTTTAPVASFTVVPDAGEAPLEIGVDASGSHDPNSPPQALQYRWDWEDDGEWDTSWSSNPAGDHVFNAAGRYTIRLQVRNEAGLMAETTRAVSAYDPPVASFTVAPEDGGAPLEISVDASGSHDPNSPPQALQYRWDWEDDGEWDTSWSSNSAGEHVFNVAGEYTIRLQVRNEAELVAETTRAVSAYDPPVAYFSVVPEDGEAPLEISVDASGSHDPNSPPQALQYRWDWEDDGTWDTSWSSNPAADHVFDVAGQYTIRLQVRNETGLIAKTTRAVSAYGPPVASFTVVPDAGEAPLEISVDAAASHDPNSPSQTLQYRWDWEDDGEWDTSWSSSSVGDHVFNAAGQYTIRVQVRNEALLTDTTTRIVHVFPDIQDVRVHVDADRDGTVSLDPAEADYQERMTWNQTYGAVFLYNDDDDDDDGVRDFRTTQVGSHADALDLAPIVLTRIASPPPGATVTLSVSPSNARLRVRIHRDLGDDSWTRVFGNADPDDTSDPHNWTFPATELEEGDIFLGIEGLSQRTSGWGSVSAWNGEAIVSVSLHDSGGTLLSEDSARLRVAPIIFTSHVDQALLLRYARITSGSNNNNTFHDQCSAAASSIDLPIALTYMGDRWFQDFMTQGYQSIQRSTGTYLHRDTLLAHRRRGDAAWNWVINNMLRPDFGLNWPGNATSSSTFNSHGNLEIAPPVTGFPLGRIMIGGGTSTALLGTSTISGYMDAAHRALLDAQIQSPYLQYSTEWLVVGHVDEFSIIIPAPNTPRGWVFGLASPDLARSILESVPPSTTVMTGRSGYQTTAGAILSDSSLMQYNDAVQARIDSVRNVLADGLDLDPANYPDGDFVELPGLYENHSGAPSHRASAYHPGTINLMPTPHPSGVLLFAADPEGPYVDGYDQWKVNMENTFSTLGADWAWIDAFWSYHVLMGAVHCGQEVKRVPPTLNWWQYDSSLTD